jgi:hypothetical protein
MTPWVALPEAEAKYRDMIESLPPGVSYFGLHCNTPGDIETIVPPRAHFRTDEYKLFQSGSPMRWAREAGITMVGMREVRTSLRETI